MAGQWQSQDSNPGLLIPRPESDPLVGTASVLLSDPAEQGTDTGQGIGGFLCFMLGAALQKLLGGASAVSKPMLGLETVRRE